MGISRVHHCIGQEMVAKGLIPPPAKRCRCREFISSDAAQARVDNGEARWIVVSRVYGSKDIPCRLCHGDKEVKNCALCAGKGTVNIPATEDIKSYDIVSVSAESSDEKEKKYRPSLAMKTPRVPTIEEKHILRAYVFGVKVAQMRIEEYGRMEREQLRELVVEIPADEYDEAERENRGRALFSDIPAPRSTRNVGHRIVKGWDTIQSDGNIYDN